jgi:UDP-2-acetamido-2,6-beta-L-arabino-hexul-4-ose reductase
MRIMITGVDGFVGSNLAVHLTEKGYDIVLINRGTSAEELRTAASSADFVYHLAGVNRPKYPAEFTVGNTLATEALCAALAATGHHVPVVIASSTQAALDNPYGRSKRAAEDILLAHGRATGSPTHIFRLTNVFGKWCRPNYNSAVATFCHNIARGLPVTVSDPASPLRLIYIDDVMDAFTALLRPGAPQNADFLEAGPVYATTVGEVVAAIQGFASSRASLISPRTGTGFTRALYSTYLSYLQPEAFAYDVANHGDLRGEFVEMMKTPDCGQFSYFTAYPGITRGEHYHHTKAEKFLVIRGTARFGFRHIVTKEAAEITVRGGEARIIETVPGWAHNITNTGTDELIVMLWANELYDPARPDTYARKVDL